MALGNQSIKDTFKRVIFLPSDNVSGSFKSFVDADDNPTGLAVSSDAVRANYLDITNIDAGTSGDTEVLLRTAGGTRIVTRAISEIAFDPSQYDSGWRDIAGWNGTTVTNGFPELTGEPDRPQYRVIGHRVVFRGKLIIPLANSGGNFITAYSTYKNEQRTSLPSSGDTGFVESSGNYIQTPSIFSSSTLSPQKKATHQMIPMYRVIESSADSTEAVRVETYVTLEFTTSGDIFLRTIKSEETRTDDFPSASRQYDSLKRRLVTNVLTGDYSLEMQDTRTSTDGSTNVYFFNVSPSATLVYGFDFDGTDSSYYGGMILQLDHLDYYLDQSVSLDTIFAAINAEPS